VFSNIVIAPDARKSLEVLTHQTFLLRLMISNG
jgi:hypothetical protein